MPHFRSIQHIMTLYQCTMLALAAWFLASTTAGAAADELPGDNLETSVRMEAAKFLAKHPGVGVTIGVIAGDEKHVWGIGRTTIGGQGDQTPSGDTLFEIGSITKVFTGTLLGYAVSQDKLKLDDSVARHLPADLRAAVQDRSITLVELATHRSGLPVQPLNVGLVALQRGMTSNPYSKYEVADLASWLARLEPAAKKEFRYSNLGAGLLGHAVTHRLGFPSYEQAVKEVICGPLGMANTAIQLDSHQRQRWAQGFSLQELPTSNWDFACLEGCGAIRSTANDMLAFLQANLRFAPESLGPGIQLAQRVWSSGEGPKVGLGWFHQRQGEHKVLWHNGGTGGYRSFMALLPGKRRGLVVLANSAHAVDALGFRVLRLLAD